MEPNETRPAPEQRRQDDAEMFEVQQLRAMEQRGWTEGRLDDLNRKVDGGIGRLDEERKELRSEMKEGFRDLRGEMSGRFEKVDKEFKAVRSEMKEGFDKVDGRFDKVDGRFDKVDGRFDKVDRRFEKVEKRFEKVDGEFKAVRGELKAGFDRMQWTLFVAAAGIIAALITAPHL